MKKKGNNFNPDEQFDDSNNSSDNIEQTYNSDGNKRKTLFIIIGIIAAIAIVFGGFFLKSKYEISSLEKKAENFIEIEDYDEALKLYSDLYSKTGNIEYKSLKNQLEIKKEIVDTIKEADDQEKRGELIKSLTLYKMIPKEDEESYKIASKEIDTIQKDILSKANSLIESGNNSEAASLLSEYISIMPEDKKGIEMYKTASGKTDSQVKEIIVNKEIPVAVASTGNSGGGNSVANAIKNTYQYITAGEANVRSSPSKGASVTGTVTRGDEVYIYDTYVESASRIWCRTDLGWVSYNTMNNTIR
ncbi:MAG: SH3 domain-containing protein [Peptostreptococcus sp.]|uniref:SH3 domain-containing protein n=1 Tax=Peptostreptococcus sp. TaxID=1262 RepID=UPI002FC8839F